ncbi:hypothetical protein M3640_21705, partial [Bacillus velezensis]|nr:hypothetical protein [Bacillus velezensis]
FHRGVAGSRGAPVVQGGGRAAGRGSVPCDESAVVAVQAYSDAVIAKIRDSDAIGEPGGAAGLDADDAVLR